MDCLVRAAFIALETVLALARDATLGVDAVAPPPAAENVWRDCARSDVILAAEAAGYRLGKILTVRKSRFNTQSWTLPRAFLACRWHAAGRPTVAAAVWDAALARAQDAARQIQAVPRPRHHISFS
jgi:hypothetical protein